MNDGCVTDSTGYVPASCAAARDFVGNLMGTAPGLADTGVNPAGLLSMAAIIIITGLLLIITRRKHRD